MGLKRELPKNLKRRLRKRKSADEGRKPKMMSMVLMRMPNVIHAALKAISPIGGDALNMKLTRRRRKMVAERAKAKARAVVEAEVVKIKAKTKAKVIAASVTSKKKKRRSRIIPTISATNASIGDILPKTVLVVPLMKSNMRIRSSLAHFVETTLGQDLDICTSL